MSGAIPHIAAGDASSTPKPPLGSEPQTFGCAKPKRSRLRRAASAAAQEKAVLEQAAGLEQEAARRRERDYRRALAAGGDVAAEARWQRLYDETLDATGSRYGLCQWDLDNGEPGACTRRMANVYCAKHSRQVERQAEQRRRAKAAEAEPTILLPTGMA